MASEDHRKSDVGASAEATTLQGLLTGHMLWLAWIPVLVIGVLHYTTGSHHHWIHDVLRRLYYLPILFAAFRHGARGGLSVAMVASMTYAPHAFLLDAPTYDPASMLNKGLEVVLYNAIGLVAGILADREAQRRAQVEQAYDDQQRMADQLVRAGRLAALGELVAGIAHELKNPLHTIKGTAEIVDEVVPKNVEQANMWKLHRQEIDRLEAIAERFLSFARPSQVELSQVRLRDLQARLVELLRARVQSSPGIDLNIEPLEERVGAVTVRIDRDQLVQAALNIAGNAITAMGDNGRLEFAMTLQNDEKRPSALLRFENNGPPIPGEDLERIFDPFCTRSSQGTGLGLPIAERIAEAHGGFIRAENLSGDRGVAFTIVLPTQHV